MAKKNKTAQRTKEEQWRRRMQQQAGRPAGATFTADTNDFEPDYDTDGQAALVADTDGGTYTQTTAAARTTVAPRTTPSRAATSAAPRRATTLARTTRPRIGANTLSLEEEMHYVRSDIRSLIILTLLCLGVLIALTFVIR